MSSHVRPTMLRALAAGLTAAALLGVSGCGPGGPVAARLHAATHRPERGVVLFICDGLHRGLLEQGCREGWLPNIQKRLVEGGVRVEHAVCEMPSITYANLTTYATGVAPARHGIVGNAWFDRRELLFRDYHFIRSYRYVNDDFLQPTIYELLRPAVTASIQSPFVRGLTANFDNWAVSGVMWFFGDYTAVDKLTATTVDTVAGWANWHRKWPTLLTCYFPGVDSVGHRQGPASEKYRWSIEHFDYQFGRVCDWLERERLLDTTTIVLVSDHGLETCQPGGPIDLEPYFRHALRRKPTIVVRQDGSLAGRRKFYEPFDTVIVAAGVRCAAIHLRGAAGWDTPPAPAEVAALLNAPAAGQRLWELPGIDLVAYRDGESTVAIRSPRGAARVEQQPPDRAGAPLIRYQPEPDDILGYCTDPELAAFVAAGFHTEREWLAAARQAEFPAVVAQLPALLLDGDRIGQVFVFAAPGYSFDDERGGHGGIRRDEVCIPFLFAGPGLPAGTTIPLARAADLVPTLLGLCGAPPDATATFDGVNLFSAGGGFHARCECVRAPLTHTGVRCFAGPHR